MKMSLKVFACFACCLTMSYGAQGMTASAVKPVPQIIIDEILPFCGPFDHVPAYLYGNPTQYKYAHWSQERLDQIKKAAGAATEAQVKTLASAFFKVGPPNDIALKDKYIDYAEMYDWVNAVNLVEIFLRDGCMLSVDSVKEINGRLTRLTIPSHGNFRTEPAMLYKNSCYSTEYLFLKYVEKGPGCLEMFKELELVDPSRANIPFCKTRTELLNSQDRYLRVVDTKYIPTSDIRQLLRTIARMNCIDRYTREPLVIDSSLAEKWEMEESDDVGHREGYIDIIKWIRKRVHHYPSPQGVNELLTNALIHANSSSMHPIEVAAILWWMIGFIHPFNNAHKRTGRILASYLLLSRGFLPPRIGPEDAELFNTTWIRSLDRGCGPEVFVNLIAHLVIKTQEQFRGQSL